MNKEEARAAFPGLFEAIREVLQRHDPSGLFAMGAPKDEHDDSINRIVARLQSVQSAEAVPEILEREVGGWIRGNGKDAVEVCAAMAPEIWVAWCEFREKAR